MSTAAHASAGLPLPSERSIGPSLSRTASVPWYIWTGVVAVTSASIGGSWDVSWHRSIGRDSFWTPAHMAIYACGLLAGIVGLWLVLNATFGHSPKAQELRKASVDVLGLRAPLGVFLAGWGGVAMLTSAPFDNWWHNAYGLDVKIISPPHVLLILGIRAISFGMLFLILAAMNRAAVADASNFKRLQILFLYLGGLSIGGQMFFLQEFTPETALHRAPAYIAMGIGLPILFATFSQASRFRWAATATAAVYMVFCIGEILILPLFPAAPKLGPVFNPVTHFIPAKFPILIILPALALDLLWQRVRTWKPWQIAVVSGLVFVAVLVAVEWPFANFLMSHASQNRFFGTIYFDYKSRATSLDRMRQFFQPQYGLQLAKGLIIAAFYAMVSTWVGLGFGRWMRGVQR
ncbi:hypothetical protein [Granulicella mallensis]|uniref:Uncharacterized protein n=1 Tax=Granulicella mallensis (strain ATCC BAA-1857 / DSM 23137 / MP5ACTX8) TaxID=682795 RepID=G8NWR7_GRAMM|nr:hypothetical protein [Granulicella mallensis]AEU38954.1 hypothetical protein AciX8_4684 [Granulicella mallensis MP5ACTX8]